MIKQILSWRVKSEYVPYYIWATLDTQTNNIIDFYNEPKLISETNFYPVEEHYLPSLECYYQRCVDISWVKNCITSDKDNLMSYGFECIGFDYQGKHWQREVY